MIYLPNPDEVAVLTIQLGYAYAHEKQTKLTRFRISNRSLRALARRSRLREVFLDDWKDALERMGWTVIWHADNNAVIRTDAIDGWSRLSSRRIADLDGMTASKIKQLRRRLHRSGWVN